jgi:hypothetical protein
VTGDIGSPGNPTSITSSTTSAQHANINGISASAIYANITTPNTSSNRGDVRQIVTTGGPFVGSLTTFAMQGTALGVPTIDIAGDLDADINALTLKRPLNIGGILPENRTIRIRQDLKAEAPVTFSALDGFRGQIIINAENGTHPWNGAIAANGYVLSPSANPPDMAPYYERLSSDLGGGAVGLAPFQLHSEDCDPPNGSPMAGVWAPPTTVTLRHYGPVTWTSGKMPVIVQYRQMNSQTWHDITSDFTVQPGPTPRDVVVIPLTSLDFDELLVYRIIPVAMFIPIPDGTPMLCADVEGNPLVAPYEYYLNYP